jgi:flagellar motor switch protein FliN/FliY
MEIFEELLERWMEEFGRAVEMFTGEKPVLRLSEKGAELLAPDIEERTWWKQIVENGEAFSIWVGSTEGLWSALSEGAEAQTTYFEMLSQANQGTASVLSAGFQFPLRCHDGAVDAPVLAAPLACAKIEIRFRDSAAGDMFLAVEKTAFDILSPEAPAAMQETGDRESAAGPGENSSMLSRLLDLRLPVSILLGRTKITIKEALKLMPGSVIELDRQVGDYVEIMVHGTVVAKGEIVSVEGNYGVRIKEVISRQDRMALHEAA